MHTRRGVRQTRRATKSLAHRLIVGRFNEQPQGTATRNPSQCKLLGCGPTVCRQAPRGSCNLPNRTCQVPSSTVWGALHLSHSAWYVMCCPVTAPSLIHISPRLNVSRGPTVIPSEIFPDPRPCCACCRPSECSGFSASGVRFFAIFPTSISRLFQPPFPLTGAVAHLIRLTSTRRTTTTRAYQTAPATPLALSTDGRAGSAYVLMVFWSALVPV